MSTTTLREHQASQALQAAQRATERDKAIQQLTQKRCIHCLALIHTEPKEGEPLPCCGN